MAAKATETTPPAANPPTTPTTDPSDFPNPAQDAGGDDPLFDGTDEAQAEYEASVAAKKGSKQEPDDDEDRAGAETTPGESSEEDGEEETGAGAESESGDSRANEDTLDAATLNRLRQRVAQDPDFAAEYARTVLGVGAPPAEKGAKRPASQPPTGEPEGEEDVSEEAYRAQFNELLSKTDEADREWKAIQKALEYRERQMEKRRQAEEKVREERDRLKADRQARFLEFAEAHTDWKQYEAAMAAYYRTRRSEIGDAALEIPFEDVYDLVKARGNRGAGGVPPAAARAAESAAERRKATARAIPGSAQSGAPAAPGATAKNPEREAIRRTIDRIDAQQRFRLP